MLRSGMTDRRLEPQTLDAEGPLVAVYLVTFRRHELLKRSIASVLAQSHRNVRLRVVNDDPADDALAGIVANFADPRAELFEPVTKRGATASFALVFAEDEADFVTLLEDDNWWEPDFLQSQIRLLERHPDVPVVVGNEHIWREQSDGSWLNTGRMIWQFSDVRKYRFALETICGNATYCNSSALIRVQREQPMKIPGTIPVDVTEHFRERTFPAIILQNGAPLTNYAETLATARDTRGKCWGHYQQLLIGSCFAALKSSAARRRLASNLWNSIDDPLSPRAVSLVLAGMAIKPARALLRGAPFKAIARALLTLMRRPGSLVQFGRQSNLAAEFEFLVNAPLTCHLAAIADSQCGGAQK